MTWLTTGESAGSMKSTHAFIEKFRMRKIGSNQRQSIIVQSSKILIET